MAASANSEPEIVLLKGQGFVGFHKALTQLATPAQLEAWRAGLTGPAAVAWNGKQILASGWYPFAWYAECHRSAQEVLGTTAARKLGYGAARNDVDTVFGFILRLAAPAMFLKMSPMMFRSYLKGPVTMRLSDQRPGSARFEVRGIQGSTPATWDDFMGTVQLFLEASGGRSVVVRSLAALPDPADLDLEVSWSV